MIMLMVNYFWVIIMRIVMLVGGVANYIYLVIIRGIFLVVYVVSIMMRGVVNFMVPFVVQNLIYRGFSMFLMIMVLLVWL